MKFRTKVAALLVGVALLIITSAIVYSYHDEELGKFMLTTVSSLTVLTAITGALYGDRIRTWVDPIKLSFEQIQSPNSEYDKHPDYGAVFVHHIRVKNENPDRSVINCRIWLEHVLDENSDGTFSAKTTFAVPRIMNWAPAEISPESRSFSDEQIFDLGYTRVADGKFYPTWNPNQGGYVNPELLSCKTQQCRRYLFRLAAENYHPKHHEIVEIRAFMPQLTDNILTKVSIIPAQEH